MWLCGECYNEVNGVFISQHNTKEQLITNKITNRRLKKICPASFRETFQCLKFPLSELRAQSRVSPVV